MKDRNDIEELLHDLKENEKEVYEPDPDDERDRMLDELD